MVRLVRPAIAALSVFMLAVQAVPARAESEVVQFPVTSYMGETIMLSARLMRPEGDGPFPAVVLLHGCDGSFYDEAVYQRYLGNWNYVLLQVICWW